MKWTWTHLAIVLGSLVVGVVFLAMSPTAHKTVFVYPTPATASKLQYSDAAGACFRFKARVVDCKPPIHRIPHQ